MVGWLVGCNQMSPFYTMTTFVFMFVLITLKYLCIVGSHRMEARY